MREWFDFAPIPEIDGPHTKDPDLLGVSEHEQRGGVLEVRDVDSEQSE